MIATKKIIDLLFWEHYLTNNIMEHKIAIIMPALNCLEYSKKALSSINTSYPYQIIVIDNGSTDGTKEWLETRNDIISYINPAVPSLSAIWNMGIERGIQENCDLFLVINNDIVLAKNTIDNLVKKIDTGRYIMVTGVNNQSISPEEMPNYEKEYVEEEPDNEHPDFSCFMINRNTIDKIGWFDEHYYVAYFEDSDYHARIALLGEKAISTISAEYYHFASKTIKENPHLENLIHEAFRHNKRYFAKKFGHENVGDVPNMLKLYWKHPFNDPDRDLKNTSIYFEI